MDKLLQQQQKIKTHCIKKNIFARCSSFPLLTLLHGQALRWFCKSCNRRETRRLQDGILLTTDTTCVRTS